jgi:hypothetical protein
VNGVNLIPAARRSARARARQARIWAGVTVTCVVALGLAHLALWNAWRPSSDDPSAELERLTAAVTAAERLDHATRDKLREAKSAAAASKEMSDQPDWGVLMTFIAGKLGDDAALDTVRLGLPALPAAAKGGKPPALHGRRSLTLTGLARTQEAASRIAIELRQSDLFDDVALAETRRTDFMSSKAVSFRIECALVGVGGGD